MLLRLLGLVGLMLVLGAGYRHYALGDWGWQRLHAEEFEAAGCDLYHAMRGLEQDPAADPRNAELVARCRPHSQEVVWSLSQTGDALRFDRPSRVRLRLDPIDMNVDGHENYPVLVVEFPYPPVPLEAGARWRLWGGLQGELGPNEATKLDRYWNPSWAGLFAEWSLGRGLHEVWLGRAKIGDARYCARVDTLPANGEQRCVMHLYNHLGEPLTLNFPLGRTMEWRLEMLDLCRFGGRVRRWQNPLLQAWFGAVEYADTGCEPYVGVKTAAPR